jgi:TRAP-type C4-dicarboxylate transport system permease small subunit
MKQFANYVAVFSQFLDRISGVCMVAVMLLAVINILMRSLFHLPVLGTYEFVGFLTAALIGLALANCAVHNGHIAISIVMEKLKSRYQAVVEAFINIISLLFWSFSVWYTIKYAISLNARGVVSPTTQIPFYPVIYIIAFGLLALCLVILVGLIESIKKAATDR